MRKNKHGFSLIEVLVALAIMASAATLLASAWGGNRLRTRKMAINSRAAFLLEEAVSNIETEYGRKFSQIPDSLNGSFADYPDWSWSMSSQEFEMPDLRSLLIKDGQGSELILLLIEKLSEYFNDSVKEIKVTVTYTKGKRSVNFSATTMLVDFDRPIPLPGVGSQ